jgi:hypothetical protein
VLIDSIFKQPKTVIASEAKQSIARQAEKWIASSLTLLAMTVRHDFAISPRVSREFCFEFLPLRDQRAQGIPGAQCTRSLACEIK